MGIRKFIPFGEFLPDRKLLGNEGLLRSFGVTPVAGNYIQAPAAKAPGGNTNYLSGLGDAPDGRTDDAYGFHVHQKAASGVYKNYAYYGSKIGLWEIDLAAGSPLSETDRSRAAGYTFSTSPPSEFEMWRFCSFGENVVATNFNDEVQFLATPGSGLFANMITSTFKPQGRFAFSVRQNLFLAYCFLPSTYDGIASGTHPQLVVWSQNDNIQAFGSENVDPALIGAGYQQFVGGDLGPITAAYGAGDFGLIFCAGGIVRIDGPPYEFRVIVRNDTTLYPYSVFQLGYDVYFWGAGGPAVLPGGEGPLRSLGVGKLQRSLLDHTTGFGADFAIDTNVGARRISGGGDVVNDLLRWQYTPKPGAYAGSDAETPEAIPPNLLLDYSLRDGRFTVSRAGGIITTEDEPASAGRDFFLVPLPVEVESEWGPFARVMALKQSFEDDAINWLPIVYALKGAVGEVPAMELRTAFGRLSETNTTRIKAVRPVWTHTEGNTAAIEGVTEVSVHTKNKPWEDETEKGPFSTFNDDGWIGTDDSVVGTYHSVTLKFLNTATEINEIHEIEGLEIEYVEGAEYGA